MSTRGTIAVELIDGSVYQVYSHFDNYPEHTGAILLECYNTLELAIQLVSGGAISYIDNDIDCTSFYARDYGEHIDVNKFTDYADYIENCSEQVWNYIMRGGVWQVRHYSGWHHDLGAFLKMRALSKYE